jgi:hypothetical protein
MEPCTYVLRHGMERIAMRARAAVYIYIQKLRTVLVVLVGLAAVTKYRALFTYLLQMT